MKTHPEQKENEVYMGNTEGFPSFSSWTTKRVGKIAYYKDGTETRKTYALVCRERRIDQRWCRPK